ncbi:hypothetical protein EV401DRAFT_2222217, partial [Pisolithus croceorrhizus]
TIRIVPSSFLLGHLVPSQPLRSRLGLNHTNLLVKDILLYTHQSSGNPLIAHTNDEEGICHKLQITEPEVLAVSNLCTVLPLVQYEPADVLVKTR